MKKQLSKTKKITFIFVLSIVGTLFLAAMTWFLVATSTVGLFSNWNRGFMIIPPMPRNPSEWGREFDSGGFTLFRHFFGGHTYIISVNDQSLVEDGVLVIPTRVGARRISALGGDWRSFSLNVDAERIVIPAEITLSRGFWEMERSRDREERTVRYVEFLCNDISNLTLGVGIWDYTLIISDGSTRILTDLVNATPGYGLNNFMVVERTDFSAGRRAIFDYNEWTLQYLALLGQTGLLRLNDLSIVYNGVLLLPEQVGEHIIDGVGLGVSASQLDPGEGVSKIVVPAGLTLGQPFWFMSGRREQIEFIEFLSTTFDRINFDSNWHPYMIIPDGTLGSFMGRFRGVFSHAQPNVLERSQFEDGVRMQIDYGGWTMRRFFVGGRTYINLERLNDPSLVINGILTIPQQLCNYKIDWIGFHTMGFIIAPDHDAGLEKIIIPAGIRVGRSFIFGELARNAPTYVEFLCTTFGGRELHLGLAWDTIFIVPDGSVEQFKRIGGGIMRDATVIESSQFRR